MSVSRYSQTRISSARCAERRECPGRSRRARSGCSRTDPLPDSRAGRSRPEGQERLQGALEGHDGIERAGLPRNQGTSGQLAGTRPFGTGRKDSPVGPGPVARTPSWRRRPVGHGRRGVHSSGVADGLASSAGPGARLGTAIGSSRRRVLPRSRLSNTGTTQRVPYRLHSPFRWKERTGTKPRPPLPLSYYRLGAGEKSTLIGRDPHPLR
jgi:hypothetical protein